MVDGDSPGVTLTSDDGVRCPYYNVGFCKLWESAQKIHSMGDCLTDSCKDKECTKSHKRKCRDEESCRFYKIDNRAIKHPPDKSAITNQTEEIINKINELMDMRDLGMMRKLY